MRRWVSLVRNKILELSDPAFVCEYADTMKYKVNRHEPSVDVDNIEDLYIGICFNNDTDSLLMSSFHTRVVDSVFLFAYFESNFASAKMSYFLHHA